MTIISKPPNRVYDEQYERIYGRKPKDSGDSSNTTPDKLDQRIDAGSKQPKIRTVPKPTA